MSTLSGKPANPGDLSGYASRGPSERQPSERQSSEDIGAHRHAAEGDREPFRSPYAPKDTWRRASASPDFSAGAEAASLAPASTPDTGWPGDELVGPDPSLSPASDADAA